jgi:DNA-binding transcriptional MocR family regulator
MVGADEIFQCVLDDGDAVLCETPLYAGALPALRAKNAECIGESIRGEAGS